MKKYQIIYADCPWRYKDQKGNNPKLGGITYPTMTLEEIKCLPISTIVAKDCILFFWTTMPLLPEGLEVIKAWKFKYITCAFDWVKLNPTGWVEKIGKDIILKKGIYSGLGHWVNGNSELCLLSKIGNPKRIRKDIKQTLFAPRGKHSQKPSETRNRIVQLMGDLPRIELFARKPKNQLFEDESFKGWDVWGDEVDSDIDLKEINR